MRHGSTAAKTPSAAHARTMLKCQREARGNAELDAQSGRYRLLSRQMSGTVRVQRRAIAACARRQRSTATRDRRIKRKERGNAELGANCGNRSMISSRLHGIRKTLRRGAAGHVRAQWELLPGKPRTRSVKPCANLASQGSDASVAGRTAPSRSSTKTNGRCRRHGVRIVRSGAIAQRRVAYSEGQWRLYAMLVVLSLLK